MHVISKSAVGLALFTILLWSFLAFLGERLNQIPPLLLVGIALCISGLLGGLRKDSWRVKPIVLLTGVGGIFGYHFLYFSAFRFAPALEANLMNYLWPLLIVLLSPVILPGYSLRIHHIAGALLGLAGAALIISGGRLHWDMAHLQGYLLAALAALVWAIYSLRSKRLQPFPNAAVGAFCLVSGILSLTAHWIDNGALSLAAISPTEWLYLFLLGAGPMGLAFFTWDAALKRGDPRIIGSLAYLTPLTSTAVLVIFGGRSLSWVSAAAMILIVGGAVLGSLNLKTGIKPRAQ